MVADSDFILIELDEDEFAIVHSSHCKIKGKTVSFQHKNEEFYGLLILKGNIKTLIID